MKKNKCQSSGTFKIKKKRENFITNRPSPPSPPPPCFPLLREVPSLYLASGWERCGKKCVCSLMEEGRGAFCDESLCKLFPFSFSVSFLSFTLRPALACKHKKENKLSKTPRENLHTKERRKNPAWSHKKLKLKQHASDEKKTFSQSSDGTSTSAAFVVVSLFSFLSPPLPLHYATMPAMRLFGRRWAMGTDDVPLLAFPVACFQVLWAAALAAAVGVAAARWPSEARSGGGPCEASVATPFMAALGGLLAAAVLAGALAAWATWEGLKGEEDFSARNGFIEIFLMASSSKTEKNSTLNPDSFKQTGSILDVDLRRRVPPLVYALVVSLAVETGFLVFATVLASRPLPECSKTLTAAAATTADGGTLSSSSSTTRHPWASPAIAVRALVFTAWGSIALLLLVAALASAAAPDPADEAAWAARCRCLVLACCPAAAVPGGRATTKRASSRGGGGGGSLASAGASTTVAAAAAVVSSSAAAAGLPRRRRSWWRLWWPSASKRRRNGRRRRTTSDDAAAPSSSPPPNPFSPRDGTAMPPASQQLSLKRRTRSLDSTGAFDESDGEEEGGRNDDGDESNSEDDSDLEEGRGNPAPPYQRLGVLFKQVRKERGRERESEREGERERFCLFIGGMELERAKERKGAREEQISNFSLKKKTAPRSPRPRADRHLRGFLTRGQVAAGREGSGNAGGAPGGRGGGSSGGSGIGGSKGFCRCCSSPASPHDAQPGPGLPRSLPVSTCGGGGGDHGRRRRQAAPARKELPAEAFPLFSLCFSCRPLRGSDPGSFGPLAPASDTLSR